MRTIAVTILYVEAATNSSAVGYLIKQTSADIVCQAIRVVHKGNTFFSPSIPRRLHTRNRKKQVDLIREREPIKDKDQVVTLIRRSGCKETP